MAATFDLDHVASFILKDVAALLVMAHIIALSEVKLLYANR
jgi:hypothetical protein